MKIHHLVKGNTVLHIRIGKTDAEIKKVVDGKVDTSVQQLSPIEANRKLNDYLRQGYAILKK